MSDNSSEAVLAILRGWNWERFEFSASGSSPKWMPLDEVVNLLAFQGRQDAPGGVLALLCSGTLMARGTYSWRAYRGYQHFQLDAEGEIETRRWAQMRDFRRRVWNFDESFPPCVDLPRLGMTEVERVGWQWQNARMSLADTQGRETDWENGPYSEEWFSAHRIEVYLACEAVVPTESNVVQAMQERNKGGAPRLYDWEGAIAAIVFQWADEGSWQPATQADVKRALADWFGAKDLHPSETELKKRARWLFDEFRRRAGEVDNIAA